MKFNAGMVADILKGMSSGDAAQLEKDARSIGQNLPSAWKLVTVKKWGFGFSNFIARPDSLL
jgi:hypothetical protein